MMSLSIETSPFLLTLAAGLPLAVWFYLFFLHGNFWRRGGGLPDPAVHEGPWPAVAVLVPARDEAALIGRTVAGLLEQDYPGEFHVFLVDDHSSDGTAARASEVARARGRADALDVIVAPDLPAGWTGKLWALRTGHAAARTSFDQAEFLWLCDADIGHPPSALRRLVSHALEDRRDLVSLMVLLKAEGFWGRLLIPPFVYFFQKLYPFAWAADPKRRTAAAAGGCVLLRRGTFERAGGFEAIRGALIDDCTLAALVKHADEGARGRIWLGLTRTSVSLRPYAGFAEVWNMVARTAYTQLHHSPLLLLGTLAGMVVTYLGPPAALIVGLATGQLAAASLGLAAWSLMAVSFLPTLRLYRLPALWAPTLPLAATLYSAMTVASAWRHWRGRGGHWKGRSHQALAADPRAK
jgi:hopene-associated glycosyltransferase HpnB